MTLYYIEPKLEVQQREAEGQEPHKKTVAAWLQSTDKTSTPVKPDAKLDAEVLKVSEASEASDFREGSEMVISNVTEDEDAAKEAENGVSQSVNPSSVCGSSSKCESFNSNTSWFLTNVNSYRASLMDTKGASEAASVVKDSFDTTSSSFLLNVNDFCGVKPRKYVNYSSTDNSALDSPRAAKALSLENELVYSRSVSNKHPAHPIRYTTVVKYPKK